MPRYRRIPEPREPPPVRRYEANHLKKDKNEPVEKLYLTESDSPDDWMPSTGAVLKMMLSLRFSAGLWSTIQDCDEVFNYWEPLHLLLFGKGLQTWEYSPLYAIRSYLYIGLHYLPASFLAVFFSHTKIAIFVMTRCLLAAFCASAEYFLFTILCKRFSIRIGRFFLLFSIFSSGMFISCSSFLPSTFSMVINTYAVAFYLREQWFRSIFAVAFSALVGWPFAALLGLPVVLELLLVRRELVKFVIYSLISGSSICAVLIYVDSYYFGKFVLAPLNIVLYNVFSPHGPNLYGVEPFSFYVKNLLLNHNLAIIFAAAAVPLSALAYTWVLEGGKEQKKLSLAYWRRYVPLLLVALSMLAWLLVFAAQPHKEERFMYPIYPLISMFAAVGIDAFCRVFGRLSSWTSPVSWLLVCFFISVSLSRSYALHRNYGAHMEVYNHLNAFVIDDTAASRDFSQRNAALQVCVGKEWYRFPSSFFLPERVLDKHGHALGVRFAFLKSEFAGLLPKYYEEGRLPKVTQSVPTEMNDANREEPSRYIRLEECDFVVDLDVPEDMTTELEPSLSKMASLFRPVQSSPFLISSRSHWLYRAFYVPLLTPKLTHMANYTLYASVKL